MKRTKKKPLIILTAGGTGGHVYPAEALAEELFKRGYKLALITDDRGKDNYKGRLGQIPNYSVKAGALVGKSKWFKVKSLAKTCLGVVQAAFIILWKRPKCVVGFGGYASFPACMAAIIMRKQLIIHEQNAVMSRTNRFLSKYAKACGQSFRDVRYAPDGIKNILTGMPVRDSIVKVGQGEYPKRKIGDPFQLMILGGSQGTKIFGEIVPKAVNMLSEINQKKLKIYHQARDVDVKEVKQAYVGSKAEVVVSNFFGDIDKLYANTHLIISRAGASSVSEIEITGLPSVLVPLPIAADDHQTYNAKEIGDAMAGIILKQKDFTVEKVHEILMEAIKDPKSLEKMSKNAKDLGVTDAAARLADAVEKEAILKW